MGRPINKRNFGSAAGNQFQITADVGAGVGTGYIVSQRGTSKFRVSVGGTEAVCKLVTTSPGVGEMNVTVQPDAGGAVLVQKIQQHVLITAAGEKIGWNFSASTSDAKVQVTDPASITISVQPVNDTTVSGAATFSVTAASANAITYQWQERQGSGSYADLADAGIYSGSATPNLVLTGSTSAEDGFTYRCVLSDATSEAPTVTSSTAALTFGS
jgi:hypothetical protein